MHRLGNKGETVNQPTPTWLTEYWRERANLTAMTEAQKLELADMMRPMIQDTDYCLFWLQVLCATDYLPEWRKQDENQ
jgi:hypothetical protein